MLRTVVLLCLVCVSRVFSQDLAGAYSGSVEGEVTVPRKVSGGGRVLGGRLQHRHSEGTTPHYRVHTGGRALHLELAPAAAFLGPRLRVERWGHNRTALPAPHTDCHYTGVVRGHNASWVALSACHGLAGMIRTDFGEYWIEPLHGHVPQDNEDHPHVIYKREAVLGDHRKKRKKHHRKNCRTGDRRKPWDILSAMRIQKKNRKPRSVSRESFVETLVVADTSMTEFHEEVERYLLTIMNMVAAMYLDPTIGNPINIVVVRIILLEKVQHDFTVNVNASFTLQQFCQWQMDLNPPDDSDPYHHDVAILVTRVNICARKSQGCSTLGVAHVGGICQPNLSCSVNQDNGIALAHTITHELGHNLGMYHDTKQNGCHVGHGKKMHVMAPSFAQDTVEVSWSPCSRRDITHFLDQGLGKCLEDEPTQMEMKLPDTMYSAEEQCRMQFGAHNTTVAVCSPSSESTCAELWCFIEGQCVTMQRPAATGTICGHNKWCQNRECVPKEDVPDPIHGGWSDWGPWSSCSRTCGAGVMTTERHCTNPVPEFGGKYCVGERKRYVVCNTDKCPENVPSFRAMQCSSFNDHLYNGKKYEWSPYFEKFEPCKLYCTDATESLCISWGDSALDGTPCNPGTRDLCVSGICRHVGCDWVIDSDSVEDQCGICRGNGTDCQKVEGMFTQLNGQGYTEVEIIPSGSRRIKIEEVSQSKNYLAIGSAASGKFYLNGYRRVESSGKYNIAGSKASYERDRETEVIFIPGPVDEDLRIYVLFRHHYPNLGVHYEYTLQKSKIIQQKEYQWQYSNWTECSASCERGSQASYPVCWEKDVGPVDDTLCEKAYKPSYVMRICNEYPCPVRWWAGPWNSCPVTCGDSVIRQRIVKCIPLGPRGEELVDKEVPDDKCQDQEMPAKEEPCSDLPRCIISTTTKPPSDNSQNSLLLYHKYNFYDHYNPNNTHLPVIDYNNIGNSLQIEYMEQSNSSGKQNIRPNDKLDWVIDFWSSCSTSCGHGIRFRKVTCFRHDGLCNPKTKPAETKPCHMDCSVQWVTGPWGSCSVTCGPRRSYKKRNVRCENVITHEKASGCLSETRPLWKQSCHPLPACPRAKRKYTSPCQDTMLHCERHLNRCDTSYDLRRRCCLSCSRRHRSHRITR